MTYSFYKEIDEKILEVLELEGKQDEKTITEGREKVLEAVKNLLILSLAMQRHVTVGMERYVNFYQKENIPWIKDFVHEVLENYMSAETVEEVFMQKYFTLNLQDYDAIVYLFTLYGVCYLINGENGRFILSRIDMLYPQLLDKQMEEKLLEFCRYDDLDNAEVQNLYESGLIPALDRKQYFIVTMTEYAIQVMEDYFILKTFLEPDEKQIALIMKGVSAKAQQRIRQNVSSRVNNAIDNELESIQVARVEDIVNAMKTVFARMLTVIEEGKYGYYCEF